ncbi:outer membrane beta-barrel protein [Bacteroidota bacterium]
MNHILRYTSFLILFLISMVSVAQEGSCAFKLEEAESLYETGILDSIPSMLRSCINNDGFDKEELARAYKLLILTYQFEDYIEMAELTMLKFLKNFPEYELKATDPVEFKYLHNSFQTIPTFSIGVLIGGNYTLTQIHGANSTYAISDYSGNYTGNIKIQGGLQFQKYITDQIDINLDILYTAKGFTYKITEFNETSEYIESQSILSFPLTGTYTFKYTLFNVINPYVRVGANFDYLLTASADYTLTDDITGTRLFQEKGVELENRNTYNISAIVGGGLKWNIKMGYIMLDLRYHYNFLYNNNEDSKWTNQQYPYETHYEDDNHSLHNLFISAGFVYPFYKTKQTE